MTPAQLSALTDRKNESEKRTDGRFGMIVATIINALQGKKGKPVSPLEVMGYSKDEVGSSAAREQTPQETALRMRLLSAAMRMTGAHKKRE